MVSGLSPQAYSSSRQSRVRGKFSVLPTPGSDIVLDRETDTLVPCDETTCPFSNLERPSKVLYDPASPYKLDVNYTQLLGLNASTLQLLVGENAMPASRVCLLACLKARALICSVAFRTSLIQRQNPVCPAMAYRMSLLASTC